MKKLTIVFQGDSITDGGRDRSDIHDLGHSYPFYAAKLIEQAFPEVKFEFINQGINANRSCQLFDRLYNDALKYEPDLISVLIGTNDIWHRYEPLTRIETSDEQLEVNLRSILESIKRNTKAKILLMSPYFLDDESKAQMKRDLPSVALLEEKLAQRYADAYIALGEHFDEALKTQPAPKYYSDDGVHPNENGARFIAQLYAEAVIPLIKELI